MVPRRLPQPGGHNGLRRRRRRAHLLRRVRCLDFSLSSRIFRRALCAPTGYVSLSPAPSTAVLRAEVRVCGWPNRRRPGFRWTAVTLAPVARRPGRVDCAGPAQGLWGQGHEAAQRGLHHDRRLAPLGRLVRPPTPAADPPISGIEKRDFGIEKASLRNRKGGSALYATGSAEASELI